MGKQDVWLHEGALQHVCGCLNIDYRNIHPAQSSLTERSRLFTLLVAIGTVIAIILLIMNNSIKSIMIGGSILAAAQVHAEVEIEVHAGYHSIYEFRGVDYGDDLIEGGVDLSYELAEGLSLTGGAWYADTNGGALEELDLYIGLTKTLGKIDVSFGYTSYIFPGTSEINSDEVYFGLATELDCGTGLSLTYYHDTNEIDGGYLEAEVSKSIELSECISLDLAAGAAWSFGYNRDNKNGTSDLEDFNHYYVSVATPWTICDNVTVTPYVKFVGAGSDLDNHNTRTASDDLFFGGITLSYSF